MNCFGKDPNQETDGETPEVQRALRRPSFRSRLLKMHQELNFTYINHNVMFIHTCT
jgi:hypothetical protein